MSSRWPRMPATRQSLAMSDVRLVFASWPEEPYLVAEVWLGDDHLATALWRGESLRLQMDVGDVDLEALRDVLDKLTARLRDNREAIDEQRRA